MKGLTNLSIAISNIMNGNKKLQYSKTTENKENKLTPDLETHDYTYNEYYDCKSKSWKIYPFLKN